MFSDIFPLKINKYFDYYKVTAYNSKLMTKHLIIK